MPLLRTRSNTAFSTFTTQESGASATNARDVIWFQFASEPLAAQTISGTLIGQMSMAEASAQANFLPQIMVRVVSGDGSTVRGTLYAGDTRTTNVDELTTALRNWKNPAAGISPVTLASVAAQAGDRLVVEIGVRANNTVTTNFNGTARIGDNAASDLSVGGSETTDLNPWVEFSQDLTFSAAAKSLAPQGFPHPVMQTLMRR